jgi:CDP-6-deoxy-D-xylo-4-hexulose-3-dehydrase
MADRRPGTLPERHYELASSTWGADERAAILRLIDEERFTMGDNVRRFEEAFAAKFGMRHAVMTNSGSSANLVAVAALAYLRDRPLQPGDEAIVPAISWATTYHPLQQYRLRLRFLDVELDTINMDVSRLEAALTPRTRMVVAVSILGNPAGLDTMRAFCDAHGLFLLEDNCESMGARLNGRFTGTFGDVNTFSTFFSHQMSTMEGGVLVTNHTEIDHLARVIRNHGWTRDLPKDSPLLSGSAGDAFNEAYRFILPGYNVRPLEMCGAVGLTQLNRIDDLIAVRRANARHFVQLFAGDDRFIIQREHGESSWFCFTIVLHPGVAIDRAPVLHALREAGIEFRMITGGCFLRHEAIRHFDYDSVGDIVNAHIVHDRGFFVGNHPRDLTAEITRLREVLDRVVPARTGGRG